LLLLLERTAHHVAYYRPATFLEWRKVGLDGYFEILRLERPLVMIDTSSVISYRSRKQVQELATYIETKALNDLDDKLHGIEN
jgi:hypothetical protein